MRKLIYHMATSVDGFMAQTDHSVTGFLNEGDHVAEYLASLQNDYDTVLMGRKTYDFGLQFGVTNPYPWLKQYVISSRSEGVNEDLEVISSDPAALVLRLKSEPGKDVYLCGGSRLATSLLEQGLIDEVILKVNPVLFGSGIPLTRALPQFLPLDLRHSKSYSNGVLLVQYSIQRSGSRS
jgi:dihydrofolate reductase